MPSAKLSQPRQAVPAQRWCALLVSHRASRIFAGTRDRFAEAEHARDDVHRHHEQGGWSQARYQRGVETEVDRHIRDACALLSDHLTREPFEHLLLGGPQELHHRVEHELSPDLRARLAGSFEIDVERAGADEVTRRATPLIEAAERSREQHALQRLEDGLAPSGHGVVGVDEVLEALNERRVAVLLVEHGHAVPGYVCPECGRLSTGPEPCPLDGASPRRQDDIVPDAIASALAEDAEVLAVRHLREQLAAHGSIAALLRF